MFSCKSFGRVGSLHYIKFVNLRFLSTQEIVAAVRKDDKVYPRKYLKPLSVPKKKPWTGNFLTNLYAGSIHKSILNYPAIIYEETIDLVLNHCSEVEGFMSNNANCPLTVDTLQKLQKLELFGLSVPQKYGGSGYTNTEAKFLLECTGVNPALGRFIGYNEDFGCKLLSNFGTEEQKEKYLPKVSAGEIFMSFAYIESGSLIDLTKFEGFAVHDLENRQFILHATKNWVHNADKSDLFLVLIKLAKTYEIDDKIPVNFKIFLVDKNTPGVTVHKLLSDKDHKMNGFEVTFKEVIVDENSILGGMETDGFNVLKFALANCFTTDAILCLSTLKQIIYNAMQFIQEKTLSDPSLKTHGLIQENLTALVTHTYALESVVYLLTGRSDLYENPDLFHESILAKALAIEFLQSCIKVFIEIVGRDALIKSGVLDKALEILQYYTVFDENIEYLKLLASSDALVFAAPIKSRKVLIRRRPYENYKDVIKELFKGKVNSIRKPPSKYNFKMELHASLSEAAENLEGICTEMEYAIDNLFVDSGNLALESGGHVVTKLMEMAAYIYASLACLSRASTAICYDFENFENDSVITQGFLHLAKLKFQQLVLEETLYTKIQEYYRVIGKKTFINKGYPAEHPLSRAY